MLSEIPRFSSYEERFPYESDYIEGDDAKVQIERLAPGGETFQLFCDASAFGDAVDLQDRFDLRHLAFKLDASEVALDFSRLAHPEHISQLYIYAMFGWTAQTAQLDLTGIEQLENLEALILSEVPGFPDLRAAFPQLRHASFTQGDQPDGPLWPTLETLQITGATGAIAERGPLGQLRRLVLPSSRLSSVDDLAGCAPQLRTLRILDHRRAIDLSPISAVTDLEYLELEVGKTAHGIDDLALSQLRAAKLSHLGSPAFVENCPNLEWLEVKHYTGDDAPRPASGTWDRKFGVWRFGETYLPDEFR